MKPILYDSTETAFTTLGIGVLADAISCYVTEERNGSYELEMLYPVTGQFAAEITQRRIILATPNSADSAQPFRIYRIQKSMSGRTITVNAAHISYDLTGYIVLPLVAGDIQAALSSLNSNCLTGNNPFSFVSSRSTVATFTVPEPSSTRSWLGGREGSLLDIYGGEWHFDGFTCRLENARGADRGARIMYGKNLLSLQQEEECSNLYSAVYPYFKADDGTVINGSLVTVASVNYTKVLALDMTEKYSEDEEDPTPQELTLDAAAYISRNNLSAPKVNLKLDFAQIEALDVGISLCDYVTVYFERFGVSATAECIKTTWDVLLDRYESIELGDARDTLAGTISGTQQDLADIAATVLEDRTNTDVMIANVKGELQTSITSNDEGITSLLERTTTIEEKYLDADGVEKLLSTKSYVNSTQLTRSEKDFEYKVTTLKSTVEDNKAKVEELSTAVKIDINGVNVSKSNSNIVGVFGNSSLDFVNQKRTRLAWISAEDDGLGAAQLSLGDPTSSANRWRIFVSSDGKHLRMTRHI